MKKRSAAILLSVIMCAGLSLAAGFRAGSRMAYEDCTDGNEIREQLVSSRTWLMDTDVPMDDIEYDTVLRGKTETSEGKYVFHQSTIFSDHFLDVDSYQTTVTGGCPDSIVTLSGPSEDSPYSKRVFRTKFLGDQYGIEQVVEVYELVPGAYGDTDVYVKRTETRKGTILVPTHYANYSQDL